MRIIHFALSCFYIEGYTYQENVLPKIHADTGNSVLMVASCISFDDKGKAIIVEPTRYHSKDGFDVIRVPFRKHYERGLSRRMKLYEGVRDIITSFKPDIMYFHGCGSVELLTLVEYKKEHSEVKLFVDNHADGNNSATNFLSYYALHKIVYKNVIKRALPYIEKVLCPAIECMDFCRNMYDVPDSKLEFYPLGGVILDEKIRNDYRNLIRNRENISSNTLVFTHSGKMDAKKRTLEIIEAFSSVHDPKMRLWIIGVLMDDVKEKVSKEILKDERITFLGWKSSEELTQYLCATDCYVQPGGQSATMQNAMCCGCAVILYPYRSHAPYIDGNGYYVETVEDMKSIFLDISIHPGKIKEMRKKSIEIASELLDYNKLAARVCISSSGEL